MFAGRRPRARVVLAVVALAAGTVAVVTARTTAAASPVRFPFSTSARAQLAAIAAEKASRTPAQRKIDSHLLIAEKRARHANFPPNFPDLPTSQVRTNAQGEVQVDVHGRMTTGLLAALRSSEAHITRPVPQARALRLRVPLINLEQLAASPDVSFIAPALQPQLAVGARTSEGVVTHRAGATRAEFGIDGTGVRIGVLSDGVNSLRKSQASGDLAAVAVVQGQAGDGDEGTAMLEIVHDVAPGAQLYFATAGGGEANFANNIRTLRALGCDIIVDDIYYATESAFQDGLPAQAVNDVTADGALYFSSALNSGNLDDGTSGAWEGDFAPQTDYYGYTWADFNPGTGVQLVNPVAAGPGDHYATLQWADPVGASANDFDLYLWDPTGTLLDASTNVQSGSGVPWEGLAVPGESSSIWGGGGFLGVMLASGAPRYFGINLNRGHWGAMGGYTPYATAGMTTGHATAAAAFGVAAAPAHDAVGSGEPAGPYPDVFNSSSVTETFSSDGPRRMFFRADGTPYTPGNFTSTGGQVRAKPDITAADGVTTTVEGFQPFFGTSAAAPHAAAIAGLLLDARPTATPSQVRAALTSTAIDIEAPGPDRDSGAGIVDALAATDYLGHASYADNRAPQSVKYGGSATISTTLVDARTGTAIPGQPVTLYGRAGSTAAWTALTTRTTSSAGQVAVGVGLTGRAQFRWRFFGADLHLATNSAVAKVAVRQLVSARATASRIRHGLTVKFYGVVTPTSAGQRVFLQRYADHRWTTKVSARIIRQTLPNGTRTTGYILPIKLTARGTYAFRVYKPATTVLAAGYSATLRVRAT